MALRDLRPLIEQPFRNFATFSGRAGRGEYWLFILSVIILTNISWLVGYGGMKLAGYPGHHDGKTYHNIHVKQMMPCRTAGPVAYGPRGR